MMRTAKITFRRLVEPFVTIPKLDVSTAWCLGIISLGILGWITALIVMSDMDQGPGTPLHGFPTFLIGWIIMLTAMMLPSEIIYVRVYTAIFKEGLKRQSNPLELCIHLICFIAGYGLAWVLYGTLAFILDAIIRMSAFELINWHREGPKVAGSVLFIAGLYQVSSLKYSCLTHCRSPLSFFAHNWRTGRLGSLHMGFLHGIVCVACCWALMAVMFAVGAMNLLWMGLLTLFMFAEKVFPSGQKLALPIAVFLWVMGIWIAVSPGSVPFLKNPLLFDNSIYAHGSNKQVIQSFNHSLLGQTAPEFTLSNVKQQQVSLKELNKSGPVVIVFYYGYYCSHCVSQLVGLNEELQKFEEQGATVVAISADSSEYTAKKFTKYKQFNFPILSDTENLTATDYKVYQPATVSQPEDLQHGTFVINQKGNIVWAYKGDTPFMNNKVLLKVLESLST